MAGLLINLIATLFMTGVVWFVQIVQYPLFSVISLSRYPKYGQTYVKKAIWVVGPVMLIEMASAIFLFFPSAHFPSWAALTGMILLLIIWISTFALQVPIHAELIKHFSEKSHKKLVLTNWIRTVCWSGRSILWIYLLTHPKELFSQWFTI